MVPGFCAASSLYRSAHVYRGSADWDCGGSVVTLQVADVSCQAQCRVDASELYLDCRVGRHCATSTCVHECGVARDSFLGQCLQRCTDEGGGCSRPLINCYGACVNTSTDPKNCGVCGRVCTTGICANGACGCPAGLSSCGGSCVNVSTDPLNCGSCGTSCGAGMVCCNGVCAPCCDYNGAGGVNAACTDGTTICCPKFFPTCVSFGGFLGLGNRCI
jgi:hypothetical protein